MSGNKIRHIRSILYSMKPQARPIFLLYRRSIGMGSYITLLHITSHPILLLAVRSILSLPRWRDHGVIKLLNAWTSIDFNHWSTPTRAKFRPRHQKFRGAMTKFLLHLWIEWTFSAFPWDGIFFTIVILPLLTITIHHIFKMNTQATHFLRIIVCSSLN